MFTVKTEILNMSEMLCLKNNNIIWRSIQIVLLAFITYWDLSYQAQNCAKFEWCHDINTYMSEFTCEITKDMLHCAQWCLQDIRCSGYSYKEDNSECRLYEANTNVSLTGGRSSEQHFFIKLPDEEMVESEYDQYSSNITLHQACGEGKLDVVKNILSHVLEDINCRGQEGRTPVMEASLKNQLKVFNYLVEQSCNLSLLDNNKNNVLHYACNGGNIEIVTHLVDKAKCNKESKGSNGKTPLLCAVEAGHIPVVNYLASKTCNMKAVDDGGDKILHYACLGGHVDMVRHILSLDVADIESEGYFGRTPLLCAVKNGHISVVNLLISQHCNLEAVDNDGDKILHFACLGGHVDMVKHIFSLNVSDIESKGFRERTPLMCAVRNGHIPVVKYLVTKHCNQTAVNKEKNTILHLACLHGHVDMVKHILTLGMVDKEIKGYEGKTPLLYAVMKGHISVVDFLISQHCNLNAVDNYGDKILYFACLGGNVDMVKHIFSLNVSDKESKGYKGRTPLLCAVRNGHLPVVKYLVSKHCNQTAVDKHDDTILHLACLHGHVDIVKHILTLGMVDKESKGYEGRTPLLCAVRNGHISTMHLLISQHCNLEAVDDDGDTILHFACLGGHINMMKHILSLDVADIESKGYRGRTPLLAAVLKGHIPVVDYLVSKQCNLKAVDDKGDKILHYACLGGHVDMVKRILSLDPVGIESKGRWGRTPVMCAAEKGHRRVVDYLASKHCNLNAVDDDGDTLLYYACKGQHVSMVKHIRNLNIETNDNIPKICRKILSQ